MRIFLHFPLKKMVFRIATIFILLFLFFTIAEGLKCYSCSNCGIKRQRQCDPSELFCSVSLNILFFKWFNNTNNKFIQKVEEKNSFGITIVSRSCEITCSPSQNFNKRVSCCSTNLCNIAETIQVKTIFILSAILCYLLIININ